MRSVRRFIMKRLKLKVNEAKSAVDIPQHRTFLGFTFTGGRSPNRRKIAPESLKRFRAHLRQLTRRNWGISLEERVRRLATYLRGWRGYFGYCETPSVLRDLDSWIRRRLRGVQGKHWKMYQRRKAELIRLGVDAGLAHTTAWSPKGPGRLSHTPGVRIALNTRYFNAMGLPHLDPRYSIELYRTAMVRTRMPGGVGGAEPRGFPLSRLICLMSSEAKGRIRAIADRIIIPRS